MTKGRALKVFGVNYERKERRVVATVTKKKAADLMGVSVDQLNRNGGETAHQIERKIALEEPGVVWSQEYRHDAPWVRVKKNGKV